MALAIECGASHSVAVFVPAADLQTEIILEKTVRYHFGPANFKLLKPLELEKFLLNVAETVKERDSVQALAVAMPGVLNDTDRNRLKNVLGRVWPTVTGRLWVGNDLESSMGRLPERNEEGREYLLSVVAISGTGSCCYGTDSTNSSSGKEAPRNSSSAKIGGYGHVLGDRGSAYSIAYRALRAALRDYEHNHLEHGKSSEGAYGGSATANTSSTTPKNIKVEESASSTPLLTLLLQQLNMVEIYELVSWSLVASKHEVADLARTVLTAAQHGNAVAQTVLEEATNELADDIVCLVNKLKSGRDIGDSRICIGLTGSMFTRNPTSFFTERTIEQLRAKGCLADVTLVTDTVLGALKKVAGGGGEGGGEKVVSPGLKTDTEEKSSSDQPRPLRDTILPIATGLAETERRNLRSMRLSSMPTAEAVELMIEEEGRANRALREHVSSLVLLIERITAAFQAGGRLLYVGAGTSGRLGILDASECPPTFKAPPHWVQGIIAGGTKAIQSSIEGAEDSVEDGIAAIIDKDVCDKDVVVGIAACGRTPFVWGGLYEAVRRGAYTAMLTFNPHLQSQLKLDQLIAINSGPEVLTGSTRLKAGTGTKVVLNMLTTLSMVRYGKCLENLMVDLMPANEKLRERALRITLMIVDDPTVSQAEAEAVLVANHYDIKRTVAQLKTVGNGSSPGKH